MRDLWLMRHGRAEGASPAGDSGRLLTADGQQGIQHIARFARSSGFAPDEVWHSPFVRATQTAETMQAAIGGKLVVDERLTPGGRHVPVADDLRLSTKNLWVVSHLPFLPALIAELLGTAAPINISPGTVTHLALIGKGNAMVRGVYEPDVTEALGEELR